MSTNEEKFIDVLGKAKVSYEEIDKNFDTSKIVKIFFEILRENRDKINNLINIDSKKMQKNSDTDKIKKDSRKEILNIEINKDCDTNKLEKNQTKEDLENISQKLDFDIITNLENDLKKLKNPYRKVISLKKEEKNNFLFGTQTDNLGTICVCLEDIDIYTFLEIMLKSILTHNSIIFALNSNKNKENLDIFKTIISTLLNKSNLNEDLIQIYYTKNYDEILKNNVSIQKVFAIGNREFQNKIKKISSIETISFGYGNYDIYIEDTTNKELIFKIIDRYKNINLYIKKGFETDFKNYDYTEVDEINEAIEKINFEGAKYSSSIFTPTGGDGSKFLLHVKSKNVGVNCSPIIKDYLDIDINNFLSIKNMYYPNPINN